MKRVWLVVNPAGRVVGPAFIDRNLAVIEAEERNRLVQDNFDYVDGDYCRVQMCEVADAV